MPCTSFHRLFSLFFMIFIVSACSLFSSANKTPQKIPPIFHWIHLDSSPISNENVEAIKSWQKIHPEWVFKLWTNVPCSISKVQVCKIDGLPTDLQDAKKRILQKEGGIFLDLRLIGCKTLDRLAHSGHPFQTADGCSIVGCPPTQYDAPREILPDAFILPDQIFITELFSSSLTGVCFWQFKNLPRLTEELRKLHAASAAASIETKKLSSLFSKIKCYCLAIFVLGILNTIFFKRRISFFISLFSFQKTKILLVCVLMISGVAFLFKGWHFSQKLNTNSFLELSTFDYPTNQLTHSDEKFLEIYRHFFEKYSLLSPISKSEEIPHIIHIIWGGPPFPPTSIANLTSWMALHPDWTVKFWTDDIHRPIPVEGMEIHLFDEILSSSKIRPYFEKSSNWGEKSDLLRYEILYREGGVYIDHDVKCLHSFAPLNNLVSFYASIEPFHKSPIHESSLTLTNCLIGVKPNHPILSKTLDLTFDRWDNASHIFPNNDQLSTLLRTLYRTFSSFDEAVRQYIPNSDRSMILPSSLVFIEHFPTFFSKALEKTSYPLANHQWENSWFRDIDNRAPPKTSGVGPKMHSFLNVCKRVVFCLMASLLILTKPFIFKYKGSFLWLKKSSLRFSSSAARV